MGRKNGEMGKADWQCQVRQDLNFIKKNDQGWLSWKGGIKTDSKRKWELELIRYLEKYNSREKDQPLQCPEVARSFKECVVMEAKWWRVSQGTEKNSTFYSDREAFRSFRTKA